MASEQVSYVGMGEGDNPKPSKIPRLEPENDQDRGGFHMPEHNISTNMTQSPMKIEQNANMNISKGDNQGPEHNKDNADKDEFVPPEHFLSQTYDESDEALDASDIAGDSNDQDDSNVSGVPDSRYTLIHVFVGGKRQNMYSCNQCDEDFLDKRVVIRHVRAHVWAEKPLKCSQCEMGFDKQWMLVRHMKIHEKTRDFVCNICSKAYYVESLLTEHVMRVHGEQHQTITRNDVSDGGLDEREGSGKDTGDCDLEESRKNTGNCGLKENREDTEEKDTFNMSEHFLSAYNTDMPMAIEPEVNIIKTETDNQEEEYSMDNSDKEDFYTAEHFQAGMDVNHVVGASAETLYTVTQSFKEGVKQETFSCNVCEEDFVDKAVCIRHVRVHTGQKPYECHSCGQGFDDEETLRRHSKTHTGEKPFPCPMCSKVFGRKDSLAEHVKLHGDISERPFPCNQCAKSFVKRFHLERHINQAHSKVSEDIVCTLCGMRFYASKHLVDHMMKIHVGDKPSIIPDEDSDDEIEGNRLNDENTDITLANFSSIDNSNDGSENIKKGIVSEKSMEYGENSMGLEDKDEVYRPEHFLSQSNGDSSENMSFYHIGGAPAETFFTVSRVTFDGRKRNRYSCNLCKEDFKDKRNCIRHIRSHTGEKPYPCNLCNKSFDKKWFLDRHMKVHEKTRDFICNICGKAFFQKRHLMDHEVRLHGGQDPDISRIDEKVRELEESFKTGEWPVAVKQNQSISGAKEYGQELDGIDHGSKENRMDGLKEDALYMQNHFLSGSSSGMPLAVVQSQSAIDTKESSQKLEGSDSGLDNKKDLENKTTENHELEDNRKYNEDQEASLFMPNHFLSFADNSNSSIIKTEKNDNLIEDRDDTVDLNSFNRPENIQSKTNDDSDEEEMDVNNVKGASAESLITLTHTYETGRKRVQYSCNVCEKEFKDKRQCLRHVRVHTGEKPYSCPQCGERFGTEGNLSRHMRTHTGEKPWSCHICNRCFTTKNSMEQHLLLHKDVSERPFPCNQCEKGFVKRSHLERHLKTHAGIREFVCDICGKDFSEKRHLLDHTQRRHSNKVQPQCKICGREFWSDYHLRMHLRTHVDASEEQPSDSYPTFVNKDEKETHANTQIPSVETSKIQATTPNSSIETSKIQAITQYHSIEKAKAKAKTPNTSINTSKNKVKRPNPSIESSKIQANAQNPSNEIPDPSSLFGTVKAWKKVKVTPNWKKYYAESLNSDIVQSKPLPNSSLSDSLQASNSEISTLENVVQNSPFPTSSQESTFQASTLPRSTQENTAEASLTNFKEEDTVNASTFQASTSPRSTQENTAEASLTNFKEEDTVNASPLPIATQQENSQH